MTKRKSERGLSFHAEAGTVSKVALSAGKRQRWEECEPIWTEPRRWADEAAKARRHVRERDGEQRPLIGINCDLLERDGQQTCFVPESYLQCLEHAGAEVLILHPSSFIPHSLLAGLVMIGGRDLDPRIDGYQLHPAHHIMHPRRERFDRWLVSEAARVHLPLLAIGVGMQTLNVVMGGTLAYHLPDDFPKAAPHYQADDPYHGHAVYCREGSLVSKVYPDSLVAHVRSQHHQAVDDVAPGFVATAWARTIAPPDVPPPDKKDLVHRPPPPVPDIIEAIESTLPGWPAIGVQWHPEYFTAMETDRLLFEYFVSLCADR
ncbi:MAG: gamma-glutamyl-gamma-aminobutyrate hydrolase family protein [Isosphaeraceae bacterium]